jgi:hypothetical protein
MVAVVIISDLDMLYGFLIYGDTNKFSCILLSQVTGLIVVSKCFFLANFIFCCLFISRVIMTRKIENKAIPLPEFDKHTASVDSSKNLHN